MRVRRRVRVGDRVRVKGLELESCLVLSCLALHITPVVHLHTFTISITDRLGWATCDVTVGRGLGLGSG